MKQRFDVTGMSCTACSSHVERAVSALAGVSSVTVDLMQNRMLPVRQRVLLLKAGIIIYLFS